MSRAFGLAAVLLLSAPAARSEADETPAAPGADVLDESVDPCADLYQYACGRWRARNPVPPDQSRWGRFSEMVERNRAILRDILEKAAASRAPADPAERLIGDYYAACMDEKGIEAKGLDPLRDELEGIEALKSPSQLSALVARLHRSDVSAFFRFDSVPDFKDARSVIAVVDQGGLALPDRDYYLRDDPKSVETRETYVLHVQRMFELAGEEPASAAAAAKAVVSVETALAKVSLARVERRDPARIYHKMTRADLAALAPGFDWEAYFAGAGAPSFEHVNVAVPAFFEGFEALIATDGLSDLKTYLRWHVLHEAAGLLPAAFVEEDFAFFGRHLTGARELKPRWNRCVQLTDAHLGEALGRRYVEVAFGATAKEKMAVLVAALEGAFEAQVKDLPWMTAPTRRAALDKLHAVANKVGYPETWRDYSSLEVRRGDALGNARRAEAFDLARELGKIGKPVDRSEWRMSPPTVNAYYSPLNNDINFPAGILQPPFFDVARDDALNFGGIGAVIGHELTHGFDDQGRKFDKDGNLEGWWTAEDAAEFEKRASCIAEQYGGYTAVDDVKLNGELTLGENVADSGGVRIAYKALMDTRGDSADEPRGGRTAAQRFFLGYAQIWCQNETDESARMRAQVDPHSPGRYRVNGVLANMPEFAEAFACKAGQPMVREEACRVW